MRDVREVAGVAAAEAWARVGACTDGTAEWEIALAEWEVCYSAWRLTAEATSSGAEADRLP